MAAGFLNNLRKDSRLRRMSLAGVISAALLFALCAAVGAQTADGQDAPEPEPPLPDAPVPQPAETAKGRDHDAVTLLNTPKHILEDQAGIWTSPLRLRPADLKWLAPLALAAGAAIVTDHCALSSVISHDAPFNHANVDASNVLTGGLIAAPVALYGMGRLHLDAHAQEAGILGGEAILDGLVVEQGLKMIFWRERPSADSGRGRFFQTGIGVDSSFPSSHSMLAWSSAAVIAQEYPNRWVQIGVYCAAAGVGITRMLGQEHFPSDVLVGSTVGWLVGHYVYRKHHQGRLR